MASGLIFLLADPEYYSHLASWRVLIRTPVKGFKDLSLPIDQIHVDNFGFYNIM
jgi:hypothetical protein